MMMSVILSTISLRQQDGGDLPFILILGKDGRAVTMGAGMLSEKGLEQLIEKLIKDAAKQKKEDTNSST